VRESGCLQHMVEYRTSYCSTKALGDSQLHHQTLPTSCQHLLPDLLACLLLLPGLFAAHVLSCHATAMAYTLSVILLVACSYGRHRLGQRMSLQVPCWC
jgi:hypothetical protein